VIKNMRKTDQKKFAKHKSVHKTSTIITLV